MNIIKPHFVISDLHMGVGDSRDNFEYMSGGRRAQEFNNFLDYVESNDGDLIIDGDLLELWQNNISAVIKYRRPLLDRLARLGAIYILGNHDLDLLHFTKANGIRLDHPLFSDLKLSHMIEAGGRKILLIHGHEQDVYCKSEVPGIGRISAIYSGIREDHNGSPLNHRKYGGATVETRSLGRWGRFSKACRRLVGKPNATAVMRREVLNTFQKSQCDALIYGHTHEPGQFVRRVSRDMGGLYKLPIYNIGTWAETVNTFVRIGTDGAINLLDWVDGQSQPNSTTLKVS